MRPTDTLHRFLFESTGIRGELVHLDASFQAVRRRYDYPPPVAELLGEAMAAVALLSATVKFEGSMVMQIQGDGPLRLVVVQCDHQRHMRGLARWEGEVPEGNLAAKMGSGRLVITIDPGAGKRRYQGIVGLEAGTLAGVLEGYFSHSEQIATRLWLGGDGNRAAGMLLQRMPGHEEEDEEYWRRIELLGDTLGRTELLELPVRELLHRLYHEETVRLFDPEPVSFRCSCTRERIESSLRGLGEVEVRGILAEQGEVRVACEFCNQRYLFDRVDVEKLFAAGFTTAEAPQTRQ